MNVGLRRLRPTYKPGTVVQIPKLNRLQRYALAVVGVVLVILAFVRIEDYGLEGSNWIVALLVGVILVLPALASSKDKTSLRDKDERANAVKAEPVSPEFEGWLSGQRRNQLILRGIKALSVSTHQLLSELLQLPKIPGMENMGLMVEDVWYEQALPYSYAVAVLSSLEQDPKYLLGQDFVMVTAMTSREMIVAAQESATRFDNLVLDPDRLKTLSLAELTLVKNVAIMCANEPNGEKVDKALVDLLLSKSGAKELITANQQARLVEFTREARRGFTTVLTRKPGAAPNA